MCLNSRISSSLVQNSSYFNLMLFNSLFFSAVLSHRDHLSPSIIIHAHVKLTFRFDTHLDHSPISPLVTGQSILRLQDTKSITAAQQKH